MVISKRVVPSLKTKTPYSARNKAFSSASGVLGREIIPWTSFTPSILPSANRLVTC